MVVGVAMLVLMLVQPFRENVGDGVVSPCHCNVSAMMSMNNCDLFAHANRRCCCLESVCFFSAELSTDFMGNFRGTDVAFFCSFASKAETQSQLIRKSRNRKHTQMSIKSVDQSPGRSPIVVMPSSAGNGP